MRTKGDIRCRFLLLLLLVTSGSAWAEVCRGTKVLKTDLAQRNAGALKRAPASDWWSRN
jgi:hypothetical protein